MYRIFGSPTAKSIKIVIVVSTVACVVWYFGSVRNRLISSPGESINRITDHEFDLERLHAAYDDVDTVLLFIGWPRSRHTLVSALIDAHPNIILSNELDLIGIYRNKRVSRTKTEIYDKIAKLSYSLATRGRRSKSTTGTAANYTYLGYKVPNQWQGTFEHTIKIIGDKVGWFTAAHLSSEEGRSALKQLEDEFKVKAKFIHVIRNPFDNISTLALRLLNLRKKHAEKENIPEQIDRSIGRYFNIAKNCQATKEAFGDRVLDIPSEDFLRDPTKYLRKICDFLEISCSEDYLRDCASIVDPVPSKTRSLVVWTPSQIQQVYSLMQPLKFLKSYSFES